MSNRKLSLIALTALMLVVVAVIATGCMGSTVTAPSGDIKKFGSTDEIRDYIKNNTQLAQNSYYTTNGMMATDRITSVPAMAVQESAAKGTSVAGGRPSAAGFGSTD